MENKKRILHRLAYMSQIRDRRVSLGKSTPLRIESKEPESKERPKEKVSILALFFQKLFPTKPKQAPAYKPNISLKEHKRFVTEIRAMDPKDNKVKSYIGAEIVASSEEEAQFLIDHCGMGYLQILGEKVATLNSFGHNLTDQDKLN